jgi:hypothetical protein
MAYTERLSIKGEKSRRQSLQGVSVFGANNSIPAAAGLFRRRKQAEESLKHANIAASLQRLLYERLGPPALPPARFALSLYNMNSVGYYAPLLYP